MTAGSRDGVVTGKRRRARVDVGVGGAHVNGDVTAWRGGVVMAALSRHRGLRGAAAWRRYQITWRRSDAIDGGGAGSDVTRIEKRVVMNSRSTNASENGSKNQRKKLFFTFLF